ncbi:unnamed protein product [Effrenium voratum]|nr:unnamed protein product [Effrenium voratum]
MHSWKEPSEARVRFADEGSSQSNETAKDRYDTAAVSPVEGHAGGSSEKSDADCREQPVGKSRSDNAILELTSMTERHSSRAMVTETHLNIDNVKIEKRKPEKQLTGFRKNVFDFLQSSPCEYTVALIIVANSAMFGVQADYSVKYPGQPPSDAFRIVNQAFNIFFVLELTLRIIADGVTFVSCWNPDFRWNVLDSLLVSLSIFEEIYSNISIGDTNRLDMTSARVMRLLRLVRVVRVFRVLRFFADLRIMVMGIMGSFKALVWALLLLFIIIYVTGIIILQFVAEAAGNGWVTVGTGIEYSGMAMFNSLERCCFTLFLCISGGISWVEVVNVLEAVNPLLVPVLSLYVAFAVFCVLNIVTGVFVERSTTMRQMDEENMMFDELESRKKWLREIRVLFQAADRDGSGQVEWLEFQSVMGDFHAQTCMKNLGFDTTRVSPAQLWSLIDYDNSGLIDIDEFADALMKLQGVAHSIDIARLRHDVAKLYKAISSFSIFCNDQFAEVRNELCTTKLPRKLLGAAASPERVLI